jgi:hypothetical protein
MDEGGLMSNNNLGWSFGDEGLKQASNGTYGRVAGPMGQFAGVKRALGSPAGRMGTQALMGMMNGQNPGQAAMGAGMDFAKGKVMEYGAKQLLGGALGGQAAGFIGGPYGMLAMAALPYLGKGISSLGKSLGIGKRSGPSAQELAMGEAKGNLAGMRGTYGTDMGTGQAMLDKYNPMLESQIGRMQELADRGLSTEYNTRQLAGAAANTENARRAAESRMRATGGMVGGGQALSGYGGINQAAVGGMAQGAYNAAQTNMNSQPGYINQLSGMIGGQINRGQGLFNTGRQGMMGLDQTLYNLNAQEKARADANAQANRTREAQMISGVANLAGTAAGMEQSRKQNRDIMNLLYGDTKASASENNPSGSVPPNLSFDDTPMNPDGSYSVLPPNYEGSASVVPFSNGLQPGQPGYDPERDAQNYDPEVNAVNSRSTPDFFDAQQFGRQFTAPPQMSSADYPRFLQQMFRGNTRQDYPYESSRSVTPMSQYMGGGFNNGQYDPDFYASQGQGAVNPRNSAQNARYVQQIIQQMFGGR